MNKTIRRASVFTLLLVVALLVRATWVQFYDGKALADDKDNRRLAIATYAQPLGNIVVGGRAITGSAETGGDLKYKRTYTDGELYAAVTGYSSQVYGATQLEGVYQDLLDGGDSRLKTPPLDTLTGERAEPGDVITTIDRTCRRRRTRRSATRRERPSRSTRPPEDPRGGLHAVLRPDRAQRR